MQTERKKVLILGHLSPIGLEVSRVFLECGWEVTGLDSREQAHGLEIKEIRGDLTDQKSIPSYLNLAFEGSKTSAIVFLASNRKASIGSESDRRDSTWRIQASAVLDWGLGFIEFCSKNEANGSFVYFSSVNASLVSHQSAIYGASKIAAESLIRDLASKSRHVGQIRFNSIRPGFIENRAPKEFLDEKTQRSSSNPYQERLDILFDKFDPPTAFDIGVVAEFLSSEKSRAINGASVVCDGGVSNLEQFEVLALYDHARKQSGK